ncbi:ArsR/SmtB family transcription factor [Niallia endozanthoxylica]|uniref:Winged helix-turn-helix transcriptional regulator n=1 Tax=Niallia endozanthoxylica TaxID=2036016 RepID=A0A5J5HE62_9BACI|nr:metalloregulator ArsR/SmtB family transcription factor [Niallia endozanthoxylica]KAA9019019.1 winged helix-turn-helix transcriptional regulator [Niallia endozanthoxylica]
MDNLELIAKQLKAVSDPNRLKLLACLKKGEVCACDFVDVLKISQPAVSQQLKKLKEAGIIAERSAGTWKHYRLNNSLPLYIQAIIDELEEISIIKCDCC